MRVPMRVMLFALLIFTVVICPSCMEGKPSDEDDNIEEDIDSNGGGMSGEAEGNGGSDGDGSEAVKCELHVYGEWRVEAVATCGKGGVRERICSVCNTGQREEIAATGEHSYGEWQEITEAGCGSDGLRRRVCAVCEGSQSEKLSATGNHSYGEWVTVKPATCRDDGILERACIGCGKVVRGGVKATDEHTYGDWVTVKPPSCIEYGTQEKVCSVCGDTVTKALPLDMTAHKEKPIAEIPSTCTERGYSAGVRCSICGMTLSGEEKMLLAEHTYVGGFCTECGGREGNSALFYVQRGDYYYVSGIGWTYESCIIVPSSYKGREVIGVAEEAFMDESGIKEVVLPDSVKYLERAAFMNCADLETIALPDGIGIINYDCFSNCTSLKNVKLPAELRKIYARAFSYCT